MTMKKTVFAFLIIITLAISCNRTNSNKGTVDNETERVESFDEFIVNFYSDTVFQQSRIKKPLTGEILEWHATEDSVIKSNWTDRDLPFVTDFSVLKESFKNAKQIFVENKESKIEKILVNNSGFSIEREYELKNGKWYLIRYDISYL